MQVRFLVESWLFDTGFRPVGVWYQTDEGGLEFWYYPEYDSQVADLEFTGPLSQQWANHFAATDLNLRDRGLLKYYCQQGGQRIDRSGPFEADVEKIDPPELIELVRQQQVTEVRDG